jgi:hypothetical protein
VQQGLLGILFGAAALGVWLWSKLRAPIQESVNPHNPARESNNQEENSQEKRRRFVTLEPYPTPTPTNEEKTYRQRKEFREWGILVVELVGLFGLLFYACITFRMWREMQTQTRTAHQQLEATDRPWIKILDVVPGSDIPIVGGLSFQKIGPFKDTPDIRVQATLQITLSFTNVGHSVADVTPNFELFMPRFSISEYWPRISAEEQRFCGSPDMSAVTAQKVTAFPGEPFNWYGGISTPIRPESINHLPEGSGIVPALIVCVSYRHKGLPSLYQTRAVYELSHLDTHSRFFDIGKCSLQPFTNSPITFCEGGVRAKLLKFDRNNMGDDAY